MRNLFKAPYTSRGLELFYFLTAAIMAFVLWMFGEVLMACLSGFVACIALVTLFSVPADGGPTPRWILIMQFAGGVAFLAAFLYFAPFALS